MGKWIGKNRSIRNQPAIRRIRDATCDVNIEFAHEDYPHIFLLIQITNESTGIKFFLDNILQNKFKENAKDFFAYLTEWPLVDSQMFYVNSKNKELIKKFLLAIDKTIPFENSIKQEVFDILGIKKIADLDAFLIDKKNLIEKDSFQQALQETLATEDEDSLWQLALFCEQKERWQDAVDCYQSFKEDSKKYSEANLATYHLLQKMMDANVIGKESLTEEEVEDGKIILTSEEFHQCKVQMFTCLNKLSPEARKDYQEVIDGLYADISGNGLNLVVREVGNNEETLIAAADYIREQNQVIRLQSEEIKAQAIKIKVLEKKLDKQSKKPNFFNQDRSEGSSSWQTPSSSVNLKTRRNSFG